MSLIILLIYRLQRYSTDHQEICMMDDMPTKRDSRDRMIAAARRVLGNLEPFDLAITQLATTADTEANTRKETP
jgi:hypothetical protein